MAAIVAGVASGDNGSNYGSAFNVNVPAGTVDDDLLIAVNVSEWSTFANSSVPAGFTPLATSSFDGGSNGAHVAIGYRLASSEPASYSFGSGSGSSNSGAIIRVTGHEGTPTIAQVAPINDGTAAEFDAPSIVPNGADDLLLVFHGGEAGDTVATWTPAAGMTEEVDHPNSGGYATLLVSSLASPPNPSGVKTALISSGGTQIGGCTISIASAGGAPPPATGSATGSLSLTGSASGSTVHAGSASGSLPLTGSATGSAPTISPAAGSASGTLSLSGTASGSAQHRGAAAGNLPLAGAATGSTAHTGSGSGGLGLSGAASGSTVHRGGADGVLPISGSASGTSPTVGGAAGTATGTLPITGSATGSTPHRGSGSGTLPLSGTSAGSTPHAGTATGTLSLTGSAAGTAPALVVRDIRVIEVTAPALAATTTSPEVGPIAAFSPGLAASTTGPGSALVVEEPAVLTPWVTTEADLTATDTEPADGWDLTEPEG